MRGESVILPETIPKPKSNIAATLGLRRPAIYATQS
jgi:hypothetical protein